MAFGGFGKGALAFYDDLEANNTREWWLANKKRYEDEIRRPMEELLEDVSSEFGEAKLFRPNRDTRFSKDKTPYKTNIAAVIYLEKGGSVYVSLAAEGLHVGGGSYHLERPQLARLRAAIDDDRTGKQIARIVGDLRRAKADVTAHDAVKTAPRGYTADHPRIDLLRLGGLAAIFAHPLRLGSTRPRPRTRSSTAGTSSSPSTTGSRSTSDDNPPEICGDFCADGAQKATQISGFSAGRGRGWPGAGPCRRGGSRGRGW